MPTADLPDLDDAELLARELLWHCQDAAVFVFDADLRLRHADGHALTRAGYETGDVAGRRVIDVLGPDRYERVRPYYERVLSGERFACTYDSAGGRAYHLHGTPVRDASGDVTGGLLFCAETVSRAEERLARRLCQQIAVADLGRLAISGAGLADLTAEAARQISETLEVDGVAVAELLPGRTHFRFCYDSTGLLTGHEVPLAGSLPGAVLAAHAPMVLSDIRSVEGISAEFAELNPRSGACVPIGRPEAPFGMLGAFCREPYVFSRDDLVFLESLANVLAEAARREEADAALRHQALHDPVTGLPNRTLLEDRLPQALAFAERDGRSAGVLFVDLDHFKVVNDSLGHQAGDIVLREVAHRLAGAVRASDTVARFGGDEFVAVVNALESPADAERIAQAMLDALGEPVVVAGHAVHVRVSIGICLACPPAHPDPHALIRDADAAMYRAKARGRNRYELSDPELNHDVVDRLHMEQELRRALADGDLRLVFQPLVSLEDRVPLGAEVLLRWQHPTEGYMKPDEFLDVAEQSGLIVPIGEWVLRYACRHAVRWSRERDFLLTVNVSAGQLADPGIVDMVRRALEDTGLEPGCLGLELTEHVLVGDESDALRTLTALKALGVKLLLDDFGTGFSSLSHLKRFPIDVVKIDRSFVEGLDAPESAGDDAAIVAAIVGMGGATGKQIVPEGVETQEQADELLRLGCDRGQGYFFSCPMKVRDFDAWFRTAGSALLG